PRLDSIADVPVRSQAKNNPLKSFAALALRHAIDDDVVEVELRGGTVEIKEWLAVVIILCRDLVDQRRFRKLLAMPDLAAAYGNVTGGVAVDLDAGVLPSVFDLPAPMHGLA